MPVAAAAPYIASAIPAIAGVAGAKQQANATADAARATAVNPWSSASQYGTAGFDPNTRQVTLDQGNNPFASLLNIGGLQSFSNAYSAPGSSYYGAPQEVIDALHGANNTDAETQDRLNYLRQQAAPENNRAALSLKDKLFSLGQLGSTSGAAGQEAFLTAANKQDLGFQGAAADWANQRAQQRFENATNAVSTGANLAGNQFTQGIQSSNALGDLFNHLIQQAGIGVTAGGGQAPGAAIAAAQASGAPLQAGVSAVMPAFQSLITGLGNKGQGLTWGGDIPQIQMPAYHP